MKGIATHNYVLLHEHPTTDTTPSHVIKISNLITIQDGVIEKITSKLLLKIMLENAKESNKDKPIIIESVADGISIKILRPTYREKFGESKFDMHVEVTTTSTQIVDLYTMSISGLRRYQMQSPNGTNDNTMTKYFIDLSTSQYDILYNCIPDYWDSYSKMKYAEDFKDTTINFDGGASPEPNYKLREYEVANGSVTNNNADGVIAYRLVETLDSNGIPKSKPMTASSTGINLKAVSHISKTIVDKSMKESLTFASLQVQGGSNPNAEEENLQSYIKYVGDKSARLNINLDELQLWTLDDAKESIVDFGMDNPGALLNNSGVGGYIDDEGRFILGSNMISGTQIEGEIKSNSMNEKRRFGAMPDIEMTSNSQSDIIPQHSSFMASAKYSYNLAKMFKVLNKAMKLVAFGGIVMYKVTEIIELVDRATSGSYEKITGEKYPDEE